MRPILSAKDTNNYALAKWLDEKLKSLSINEYTISDIFQFSEEFKHLQIGGNNYLVSYDVTALFTNVPLEETIQIIAKKAFNGNWFNNTHNLNISEGDLIELLRIATKGQLFQFNCDLICMNKWAALPWKSSVNCGFSAIHITFLTPQLTPSKRARNLSKNTRKPVLSMYL